jgi:hypothetical protein
MTVPVNFDRGAVRSGIKQIGNVIIFHLWSSFMQSHSWAAFCWVLLALYGGGFGIICGAFAIIRGGSSRLYAVLSPSYRVLLPLIYAVLHHFNIRCGFAIIRSGSSIIRGAFNIIRDAFIQHYFHILSMYMISRLLKFGMWLIMLFGFVHFVSSIYYHIQ